MMTPRMMQKLRKKNRMTKKLIFQNKLRLLITLLSNNQNNLAAHRLRNVHLNLIKELLGLTSIP